MRSQSQEVRDHLPGLRIGSATAKGLGLALNKPIINVPTVDALAYNLVGHAGLVCPLMDARRNQTYTGLYSFDGNEMEVLKEQCAVGIDEIISIVNQFEQPVTFLGWCAGISGAYSRKPQCTVYICLHTSINREQERLRHLA